MKAKLEGIEDTRANVELDLSEGDRVHTNVSSFAVKIDAQRV
jgi:hypothetical protein